MSNATNSNHPKHCACDLTKGEVCDLCNRVATQTITELSDYVSTFIDRRFPEGLPDNLRGIVADMVIDAFHDGARWAESATREESRIIQV